MATEVKRVYDIEIKGTDSLNELKNAVEQLNEKLKTLNETSKEYKDTLTQLTELQSKLANAMNGIGDSTQKAADSLKTVKDTATEATQNIKDMGDASEKTKENLENMGGANTIKELKAEIKSLKAEFSNLEIGSEGYIDVATQIANEEKRLKAAMQGVKTTVDDAGESYNSLSIKMRQLKEEYHSTNDEARRNELAPQIAEIQQKLKDMDAAVLVYSRNVGNYSSALDGLDASFVNWKQELRECKEAMQQLDPASQAYADAMARAAEITHNLADQQEMIKYSSTDFGDQLENVRGIATNLAAGYSAVNAAMGLFGEENEDVKEAMLKVQQAMALVQGLQGIDGFIKRTKGLSQSLGLVTKATQANTVATKANATAAKADAAAMAAETVATKAAVPAQLSLNAAMKANPIGFIIGLIATLVTAFALLKDKIMEMIGANKDMSAAFDKVKAVLSGFGNIIKKSVINPVKMAIIPIKTLAKVMIDLFKGDWSKIGDDFKEGMNEMKDTAIDTINVVGAFKEGYDKKSAELAEAARKKEAEARSKELDEIIKDNEAKYKSDWKYTEEGKKAYMEYFKSLTEMYDKDSDEYKQALRDKEAYLRDFNEKAQKEAEDMAALELKIDIAKYGEQAKYSKEWYDYEKKMYQDAMKLGDKYRPPMANIEPMPADVEKKIKEAELRWKTYLNDRNAYFKKKNDDFNKELNKLTSDFKSKFDSLVADRWKAIRSAQDIKEALSKTLKIGNEDYEALELYIKKWEEMFKKIGSHSDEEIKTYTSEIEREIKNGAITTAWEAYVTALKKPLEKTFYDMDKTVQTFVEDLELKFEEKKLLFGIEFPEDEINRVTDIFNAKIDNANAKAAEVRDRIDLIFEAVKENFSATTEEELAAVLPTFSKLLEEEQNYCNESINLNNQMVQKISDINAKAYENELNLRKKNFDSQMEYISLRTEMEEALYEKEEEWSLGTAHAFERPFKRQRELLQENRDATVAYYQDLLDTYKKMSQDMTLTAEEREQAIRDANNMTAQIQKANYDYEIQLQKSLKDGWKAWADGIKDALSSVGEIVGTMGDYYTGLMELEKSRIDQMVESKEISEDTAAKMYEQQKDNFEKSKAFQIAQTVINGLTGAISAYQSMASIPYVGPFLGAAAAAAVAALTAVNVQKIKATTMDNPYSSGSGGGGGSSSTNFQLPSVMEMEPSYVQNQTGMSDIDNLNNDGSGNGRGRGETAIKAYIVESEVSASQELARKRSNEVTF